MVCLSSRASHHRAVGNSNPRHTDKWQPGSGSRKKLPCLNLSLERQPKLFRSFHSASGRDSTRKVRTEETGRCLGVEEKGQSCCPQKCSTKVPCGHPRLQHAYGVTVILGPFHDAGTSSWLLWNSSFMLHRAGPHSQGTTLLCVTQGNKDP